MNASAVQPRATHAVILIAEDNEYDRLFLQEAFAELGLQVTLRFVSDGQEVLDYVNRREGFADDAAAPHPAVLLLDLNMPRMTGSEAMVALRADPKWQTLPIIVLSTSDHEPQIAQAYADGANAFMTKPGAFEDLVAMVRVFAAFWLETATLPPSTASA